MKGKLLIHIAIFLFSAAGAVAQDAYNARAKKYVAQYSQFAIEEQRNSGVPAAITLGQGILETEAGASELMVNANNHFGIKCKNDWQGETYSYTDDAPNECFKKYKSAEESFRDHSLHLKRNPRYSALFHIPLKDYEDWARGLKKCGYATNPQYAQRLIRIIEEFKLQEYTKNGLDESYVIATPAAAQAPQPAIAASTAPANVIQARYVYDTAKKTTAAPASVQPAVVASAPQPVPAPQPAAIPAQKPGSRIVVYSDTDTPRETATTTPIGRVADSARKVIMQKEIDKDYYAAAPPVDTGAVTRANGLRAFRAHKGEMLLKYAVQYKIRYPQLLEMNDLPDGPLPFDSYVYLQKKNATGVNDRHTVKDNENLLMIAQEEGIQLKRLMALNHLNSKDEPVAGAILELQTPAMRKPEVKVVALPAAHMGNAIGAQDAGHSSDYITLGHKPAQRTPDTLRASVAGNQKTTKPTTIKNVFDKFKKTDSAKSMSAPVGEATTAAATPATAGYAAPLDSAEMPVVEFASGEQTNVLTNKSMQWEAQTMERPKEQEPQQPAKPDPAALARIKAELDQFVYADDSRLIGADPARTMPSTSAPAAKTAKYYTVKHGETAYSVARINNIAVSDLLKWNNISSAADIKAGQELKVSE
jgi:LysM repeat protein